MRVGMNQHKQEIIQQAVEFQKISFRADVILAVGGGSTIDTAKAIALGVPYDGDVWDLFAKKASPVAEGKPAVACVLTIPAAGSEASDSSVISNDDLLLKRGLSTELNRPELAVMDPELTFTLPAYQTAAGVTDMIAHIMERYFSSAGPVPVTDNIACGLVRALMDEAPRALAVLAERCPEARLVALPGDEIRIEGPVEADEVGRALMAEGIAVSELHRIAGDREAFFVDLMGGGDEGEGA